MSNVISNPFPHLYCRSFIDEHESYSLGNAVFEECSWKLGKTEFYEQWENSTDLKAMPQLKKIVSDEFVENLRNFLSKAFNRELSQDVQVNVHRMTPGQRIAIHTDEPRLGYETHRALIYLNNNDEDFHGGEFLAFKERNIDSLVTAYAPCSGTLIAFEASRTSYHAVMPIISGARIAVQFYFWHAGNTSDIGERVRRFIDEAIHAAEINPICLNLIGLLKREKNSYLKFGSTILLEHLIEVGCVLARLSDSVEVIEAGFLHAIFGNGNYEVAFPVESEEILKIYCKFQVRELLDLYSSILTHADLVRLYHSQHPKFEAVFLLWLANTVSSRKHTVFSYAEWEFETKMIAHLENLSKNCRTLVNLIYG